MTPGVSPFPDLSFSPGKIKTVGNNVAFAPIPCLFLVKAASGFPLASLCPWPPLRPSL